MTRTRMVWAAGLAVLAAAVAAHRVGAQGGDLLADYERAASFGDRTEDRVFGLVDQPRWVEDRALAHYRRTVRGGHEFVLVDAEAGTQGPAFDHARLAAALSSASGTAYTALELPFGTFTFTDGLDAIEFSIASGGRGGGRGRGGRGRGGAPPEWRCSLQTYACERNPAGGGRPGGAGGAADQVRESPDGHWEAVIVDDNVAVRPAGDEDGLRQLSVDGSAGEPYRFNSLVWSPDSTKLAAYRARPGYERLVTYVESSPEDQVQPRTSTRVYRKPGDPVDIERPAIFNVETGEQFSPDAALFENPYDMSPLRWWDDSRGVTFEYNQRGHQVYRVIEIDAATGAARALVSEEPETYFCYYDKKYRYDVDDGRELIWMSERDGWNHLYLYDGATGRVKNQITTGEWVVRDVDYVDEEARQIWFSASGMHPGRDPYLVHHFRINFDGTGLTPLTDADASHNLTFDDDHAYYLDTYSRVDLPPVTELRRGTDGSLVMTLEEADMTDLRATGWQPPEVFSAKGRDGETDIWGVIIRPTNFDPARRYPVIEYIYAGPHSSFVPKTFSTQSGMNALAELGFIVVQIDGMGTSNRSKAFHDVSWKNIKDAGFPDRILWHQAVAARYPWYDISRVGIYGTSAGGQNSTGALLFHGDFYKVAVSAVGCHDNRMDKISWNEQFMSWPVGPHYEASSNVVHAANLTGELLLVVGELDTNVDPSSTLQVADALIRAGKMFDLLVIPGAGHGSGGAYGARKRDDFFVRHLRGLTPPAWNAMDETLLARPAPEDFQLTELPAPEANDPYWK